MKPFRSVPVIAGCRSLATIVVVLWANALPSPAAQPGAAVSGESAQAESRRAAAGSIVIEGLATAQPDEAARSIRLQRRFVEANGVTTARADDAAFFLRNYLRESGLMDAQVDWRIDGTRIVLTVEEGPRIVIGELAVTGNANLSTEAVRELVTARTRERFGMRTDAIDVPYVLSDIHAAPREVENLYRRLGYRDVVVELAETRVRREQQRVDLTFRADEGLLYRVGDITLPALPPGAEEEGYAGIGAEFRGRPYTRAVTANLVNRVAAVGKEAGYFEAEARADAGESRPAEGRPGERRLDLAVEADWGRRFTLEGLQIEGLEKIDEEVVARRYRRLAGLPFSPSAVNETTADFLQTGAFESLIADPIPLDDDTISLEISAAEGKRQRIGIYGGFDSYLGQIIGVEHRNVNAFGKLITLDSQVEYSGRGIRGEVGYLNPWLGGTDWEATLGVFSRTLQNEGYKTFSTGASAGIAREFGRHKRHEIRIQIHPAYTDVTDFEIERRFIGKETYFNVPVSAGYTYSRVDNEQAPTKGFIFDLGFAAAGSWSGSEIEYTRGRTRAAYYHPIGKTTLRLGARAGVIWPADDLEFPIDLRYFSGGANSVRSFRERDLGPKDRIGYPIGGEFFTIFNAEYHIPVSGSVTLAPFFDAGNLLRRSEDASLDDMHYAGGLSLIFNSPIGPLRIDYGHNLNQNDGEPSGTWHLGFGFAF